MKGRLIRIFLFSFIPEIFAFLILHDGDISFQNGSYKSLSIRKATINNLVDFVETKKHTKTFSLLLDHFSNAIISELVGINLNKPKVSFIIWIHCYIDLRWALEIFFRKTFLLLQVEAGDFFGQNTYLPFDTVSLMEEIRRESISRLLIITYHSCQVVSLQQLMDALYESGVEAVCRVYDPFNIRGMSLTILLKHADGWDYNRFLLLLSPFDNDLFREFLDNTGSRKPYRIFTPNVTNSGRNQMYLRKNQLSDIESVFNQSETTNL